MNSPCCPRRDRWTALLCVAGWTLAAALTHALGIWWAMGSAGLVLGTAALVIEPKLRRQLRAARTPAVWGLATGLIMAAGTYLLYPPASRAIAGVSDGTAALYRILGGTVGAWRALLICLIGAAEEIVWRGAVQRVAVRRFGGAAGVLITVIVYAAAVVPVGSPLLVALSFTCGLAWGALAAGSGGLIAPVVAHLTWTLTVLVLAPLAGHG